MKKQNKKLSEIYFNISKYVPEKIQKLIISGLVAFSFLPTVFAYSVGVPVFDLWTVFVVNVFGGFWLSVLGLMTIIGIIMVMGGLSILTLIYYEMIFLYAMAIGYSNLIGIFLFGLILFWSIIQVGRLINSSQM